ncbi:MAG: hypothetical protein HRT87_05945 [Legionellales bacterium]|nr:hypothetical protein [Legionellales bacterium]
MIDLVLAHLSNQIYTIKYIVMCLNAIVHIIFAGAIAKDAGALYKRGYPTIMVSGITWSFATLLGGVLVATIYWLLHHSTIARKKSS